MHEAKLSFRNIVPFSFRHFVLCTILLAHAALGQAAPFQTVAEFEALMGTPKYYVGESPVYYKDSWRPVRVYILNGLVVSVSVYIHPKNWKSEYETLKKLFGEPVSRKWWRLDQERIYKTDEYIVHVVKVRDNGGNRWLVSTIIRARDIPTIPLLEVPNGEKAENLEATLRHRKSSR